ncbi:hypothetical protein RIF29_39929 [Crotalaria pallida]|uniref:CCR4-NOT transcription complex subunit 1-like NOT1 connector domain-containing protein n=1 Tax=Crotalaria pallida TaxID=3830 RepID=A0AAN9E7L3_CROPI
MKYSREGKSYSTNLAFTPFEYLRTEIGFKLRKRKSPLPPGLTKPLRIRRSEKEKQICHWYSQGGEFIKAINAIDTEIGQQLSLRRKHREAFHVVISEVPEIIFRCVSRDEAALAVAQKVFKGLYDNASNSIHVGAHLGILIAIRDVCKLKF